MFKITRGKMRIFFYNFYLFQAKFLRLIRVSSVQMHKEMNGWLVLFRIAIPLEKSDTGRSKTNWGMMLFSLFQFKKKRKKIKNEF